MVRAVLDVSERFFPRLLRLGVIPVAFTRVFQALETGEDSKGSVLIKRRLGDLGVEHILEKPHVVATAEDVAHIVDYALALADA